MPKQDHFSKISSNVVKPVLQWDEATLDALTIAKDDEDSDDEQTTYIVSLRVRVALSNTQRSTEAAPDPSTNAIQRAIDTNTTIDLQALDANKLFERLK